MSHKAPRYPTPLGLRQPGKPTLNQKERAAYDVSAALRAAMSESPSGFEAEVSRTAADASGFAHSPRTVVVPWECLGSRSQSWQNGQANARLRLRSHGTRATSTTSSADDLVASLHASGNMAPWLTNRLILAKLGANVITGVHGIMEIPRPNSRGTAGQVAEGGTTSETDMTFANATATPRTSTQRVSFSKQLLNNAKSSPALGALIDDALTSNIAEQLEYQALHGDGTGQNHLGLFAQPTAVEVPFAQLTYRNTQSLITAVDNSGALRGDGGDVPKAAERVAV